MYKYGSMALQSDIIQATHSLTQGPSRRLHNYNPLRKASSHETGHNTMNEDTKP